MSDSRLEKFIYAICSMDVSDLPVPLSRIETLWNCLITGETPDFEPLSRNEKYLMAMLDRYDISNLPAPMSRGEKLLYKIAVGETDLSDVPDYLSRYEELLKYLIENGGISGGDFEYVLYTLNQSLSTLYNTAEKPVKSAILKGNTKWTNANGDVFDTFFNPVTEFNFENGYLELDGTLTYNIGHFATQFIDITNFDGIEIGKEGTYYGKLCFYDSDKNFIQWVTKDGTTGIVKVTSIPSNAKYIRYTSITKDIFIKDNAGRDLTLPLSLLSVKMPVLTTTGKNLFDISKGFYLDKTYDTSTLQPTGNGGLISNDSIVVNDSIEYLTVTRKSGSKTYLGLHCYDSDMNLNHIKHYYKDEVIVDIPKETKFVKVVIPFYIDVLNANSCNFMVEVGQESSTTYEPYKTNILTVNDDVTLRGIGKVQDTLDCLTGQVTERIGEVVLDGSESGWLLESYQDANITIRNHEVISFKNNNIIADGFSINPIDWSFTKEGISIYGEGMYLTIAKEKLNEPSFKGMKEFLSTNPITIQYQLATESIKTVDLTTVDQDGQPTKLKTFNDITYVEIKADNLIPSVDLEVATKISETLSTMGLEHHDISETQNKLSQTVDEQTENTDATMMATTEIYEQTL